MAQVKVSEGVLEGELLENEYGGTYYSFKGIPYAEPPLGDLRFKAPQPLKPWNGVRAAKEHGSICYQYDMMTKQTLSGTEDCLYLNVYSPDLKPKKPLPVMFFIHGGGFVSGSGNDDIYGPKFIVMNDVILVTINYRLEVLGFLCLDTEDIPGNAGMKDQVAALRWVKNNIKNFGGDPENITIFGESAGSASVTYHMISPMSKGLFKRAIAQSGAATNHWSQAFEPRERALALARSLGCESNNDKEIYEFFKSQPVENLVNIKAPITFSEASKVNPELKFGIASEIQFGDSERFFYGDVLDTLKDGIHEGIDVIAGYCTHEGLICLADGDTGKVLTQAQNYLETFVPNPIAMTLPMNVQFQVARRMKRFYFENDNISMGNLEKLINYFSTYMFNHGITTWLDSCAQTKKNKVYAYKFSCSSEQNFLTQIFGLSKLFGDKKITCHADDIGYLFEISVMPHKVDVNSDAFKMVKNVTKLWTNFAKFGNPTPDGTLGVQWQQYSPQNGNYLDIGEELVSSSDLDFEEAVFWRDLFRVYHQKRHVLNDLDGLEPY